MESPAVDLQPATPAQAPALENLFELYAHDLSAAFELEVGDDGRFGAARLARTWSGPERCFPFLIRVGRNLGGFVLATQGSPPRRIPPISMWPSSSSCAATAARASVAGPRAHSGTACRATGSSGSPSATKARAPFGTAPSRTTRSGDSPRRRRSSAADPGSCSPSIRRLSLGRPPTAPAERYRSRGGRRAKAFTSVPTFGPAAPAPPPRTRARDRTRPPRGCWDGPAS